MEQYNKHYKYLSILAFAGVLLLIIIQVNWLKKAAQAEYALQKAGLEKIAPEVALAVNSLDHGLFHNRIAELGTNQLPLIRRVVDSVIIANELAGEVYFALFQEQASGLFLSDTPEFGAIIRASKAKACMTCITAFSISSEAGQLPGESDESYRKRLTQNSTFQYYSPIINANRDSADILYLSIYQVPDQTIISNSLIYTFLVNMLLLLALFSLMFYLLRSLTRHKQISKVKDDFFNNMTHEFKTPLASIRLASRVLRKSKNPEKNASYHQLIEVESQRLEQQIDGLLHLSSLENKELLLDKQVLNIHELLRSVPERLKAQIENRNAKVSFTLEAQQYYLNGDYDHLTNSFCNLVENSLKYASPGVEISLKTSDNNKGLQIEVSDNGPGIAPVIQPFIFDRFYRGNKNYQYKGRGFGIGLSYVKSIIEQHGGRIKLNSSYQDGCQFIIELV